MASRRAKHLVHLAMWREDRVRVSDARRHVAIHLSEFTRTLKQCRKDGTAIYLDQFGRCYVPAPSEWLRELDVENDPDVQQLGLRVMFVDNEAGRSSSAMLLSERRMLLVPGDVVELRTMVTKRSAVRNLHPDDRVRDMSVFAVHGHGLSRCFIVYLHDETM